MIDHARLDQVLGLVLELAGGNLAARLAPSGRADPLDRVIDGLNLLGEELSARTAALKRSEESFRSLIERSPDAMFVHRGGRFVYVNAAALALLGYESADDVLGRAADPLFCFREDERARSRAEAIRGSTPPPAAREGRLVHRDGSSVDVEVVSIQVDFDGEPAELAIARDISSRKQLTAKMMEMDRMLAVGTLAAGVGHEINNPLAYIVSNLDFALGTLFRHDLVNGVEQPLGRERELALREALAEAREGAERVRQIVQDLKTFSRTQEVSAAPVELEPVLESSINMAFNEIRHRARLVREYGGKLAVTGSASRLSQVFLNLLVNAAHAIPEGAASEHRITVRTRAREGRVHIEVIDTGVGIEPQHLSRLFDPFFTTKPVGQGMGLGLYICKRIVREHGGELEVESRRGEGSVFRVILPAQRPGLPRSAPKAAPCLELSYRARILVVDDEPSIGRSLQRVLGREHEVSVLTDAREAFVHLLEGSDYDLVLCDVMMPEMTGVELHAELERKRPEVAARMLFFTGGAFTPATQEFVRRMGDRCLEKPVDVREIRRRLAARARPVRERANEQRD